MPIELIRDMAGSNKSIDDLLDKMGVPKTAHRPITDISYEPKKKQLVIGSDNNDVNRLNVRKAIFRTGALLKTKQHFHAYYSDDVKKELPELYLNGTQSEVGKGAALMVLKEGIIRTKYDFAAAAFDFGISSKRDVEVCYRHLVALTTWGAGEHLTQIIWKREGKPAYVHILINPEFDVEDLKTFFEFSDEAIVKSNSEIKDYKAADDLTLEIDKKLDDRRNNAIDRLTNSMYDQVKKLDPKMAKTLDQDKIKENLKKGK